MGPVEVASASFGAPRARINVCICSFAVSLSSPHLLPFFPSAICSCNLFVLLSVDSVPCPCNFPTFFLSVCICAMCMRYLPLLCVEISSSLCPCDFSSFFVLVCICAMRLRSPLTLRRNSISTVHMCSIVVFPLNVHATHHQEMASRGCSRHCTSVTK